MRVKRLRCRDIKELAKGETNASTAARLQRHAESSGPGLPPADPATEVSLTLLTGCLAVHVHLYIALGSYPPLLSDCLVSNHLLGLIQCHRPYLTERETEAEKA